MINYYTVQADKYNDCGHKHRSIRTAYQCLQSKGNAAAYYHGYIADQNDNPVDMANRKANPKPDGTTSGEHSR